MSHGAGQGFGGEGLAISRDQDRFAPLVSGIEDFGKHRCNRNEKPLASGPGLVLALGDVEAVELTFLAIDHDPACDPLVPSQIGDIAATIAQPKREAIAGTRSRAERPALFKLLHCFAWPSLPACVGGTPFHSCGGIDFDPFQAYRDIDEFAYRNQQVLSLVWCRDEASQKLLDVHSPQVLNGHIAPCKGMVIDNPQAQKFLDQTAVLEFRTLIMGEPLDRCFQSLLRRTEGSRQGSTRHPYNLRFVDLPALDRGLVGFLETYIVRGGQRHQTSVDAVAPPRRSMPILVGRQARIFVFQALFHQGPRLFSTMIPLQEKVDNILFIVAGEIGERGLQFEAIPDYTTIYFLRLWHAAVGDHLVKFGYAYADIASGLFT